MSHSTEEYPKSPPRSLASFLAELTRSTPECRIPGRNLTKADVAFYRLGDVRVAVKSYSARPVWIRLVLGRWLIGREAAAFRIAHGSAGLPAFYGRLDPYTLVTEWVDAQPLRSFRKDRLDERVFDSIAEILGELHRRGIAVADLHHRDVLLTTDGSVFLVDLAAAWVLGDRPGRVRRKLFDLFCGLDRIALARMRARWTGRDTRAAADSVGGPAVTWYRRGQRLKSMLNRLRGKKVSWETDDDR